MQNKETLSAYMDGYNVNGEFTDTLCQSEPLQQTWASYHTIRSIMRGEEQLLDHNFSAKMEQLLDGEVMESTTDVENVKKQGVLLRLRKWGTPILQAGIAASVCLVAVLGVNVMQTSDEVAQVEQPVLQTLPFSNSVQQVSYNVPEKEQPTQEQLEYQQHRINALLQNHELQLRVGNSNEELNQPEKVPQAEIEKPQQPTMP